MKIKIISLNIYEGGQFLDRIIEFFKNEDADILALQEVYSSKDPSLLNRFRSVEILSKELPGYNIFFATEFIDNRKEGKIPQGNALFSKYPITSKKVTFLNRSMDKQYDSKPENWQTVSRNMQIATISTPVGTISVINFHGIWDLDGDNFSELRQKMSQKILNEIKGKEKLILAGDTNAKPTNRAIKALEHHLNSVFGRSLTTTFNMKHKDNPGYATAAVDMIFTSRDIRVISKSAPNMDLSDHLPLIAELKL